MGEFIKSYRDLRAWQEGMNLAEACYRITQTFPREELYGIISQIRIGNQFPRAQARGPYKQKSSVDDWEVCMATAKVMKIPQIRIEST
ncbi:four helix bundle protein [Lyngbya sp. CCY1209]|jgi:hypothetical protein|uniref:four helix bundle protein n=1 Tax=Lyngbya sp. CCY1209 TaxID=2886103 RepID=UPI002D1FD3D9|nr:four helix bundle protein [Lyngbya sp. CCY1209]